MRQLIKLLLVFIAATALGITLANHPGMVTIGTRHWQLQCALSTAVVSLILLVIALYVCLRSCSQLGGLPRNIRRYQRMQRARKARRWQDIALNAALEGRWQAANKALARSCRAPNTHPHYQLLRKLCQAQYHEFKQSDDQRQPHTDAQNQSHTDIVMAIIDAQFGRHEAVLERLKPVLQNPNKSPMHTSLLVRAALACQEWPLALRILSDKRPGDIPQHQWQSWRSSAFIASMQVHGLAGDWAACEALWRWQQKIECKQPEHIKAYLQAANCCQQAAVVQKVALRALKQSWNSELLQPYMDSLSSEQVAAAIVQGEKWLKCHENDAQCRLFLGRLYNMAQRSNQAIDMLQQTLKMSSAHTNESTIAAAKSSLASVYAQNNQHKQAFNTLQEQ